MVWHLPVAGDAFLWGGFLLKRVGERVPGDAEGRLCHGCRDTEHQVGLAIE